MKNKSLKLLEISFPRKYQNSHSHWFYFKNNKIRRYEKMVNYQIGKKSIPVFLKKIPTLSKKFFVQHLIISKLNIKRNIPTLSVLS